MILHTLNAAPDSSAFNDCLRLLSESDAVLLTGEGIYAGIVDTVAYQRLLHSNATLYALEDIALATGVTGILGEAVKLQSYDDFAQLTEQFERQLAWY